MRKVEDFTKEELIILVKEVERLTKSEYGSDLVDSAIQLAWMFSDIVNK